MSCVNETTRAPRLSFIGFLKTKNRFSLPLMATVTQGNLRKEGLNCQNMVTPPSAA